MKKIVPFLWFDDQAVEAAKFYCSVFPNSKIKKISYTGDGKSASEINAMMVTFVLNGRDFMALNGGPVFKFSPAISLYVNCEDQVEIDSLWEKLSEGGEKGQCGWLTDKFGISWQIVPTILGVFMADKDRDRVARVMNAVLQMGKLEIAKLEMAYEEG